MRKRERLELIKKLILEHKISTQQELLDILENAGQTLTQATISRDMNEIGIIKIPGPDGSYIYGLSKDKLRQEGHRIDETPSILAVSPLVDGLEKMIHVDVVPGTSRLIKRQLLTKYKEMIFSLIADDDSLLLVAKTDFYQQVIRQKLESMVVSDEQ
ncbi:arginine repressor [Streptococcus caprae]|uniref:Arginine repressor n=1 Tax=Streptococcus caprae TaxID=1640501 RepID=A0ABV8CU10_9STRE